MITGITSIANVAPVKVVEVNQVDYTYHIMRTTPIPTQQWVALQYSHKGKLEYKDTRVNKIVDVKA